MNFSQNHLVTPLFFFVWDNRTDTQSTTLKMTNALRAICLCVFSVLVLPNAMAQEISFELVPPPPPESPIISEILGTGGLSYAYSDNSFDHGDVDNDGDIDVIVSVRVGTEYFTKLYLNNGAGHFTEDKRAVFAGVYVSAVSFSDIDLDDDLDVILLGYNGSVGVTKLYINQGDGSFLDQPNVPFAQVSNGDIATGDVDGDNDIDIFITGRVNLNGIVTSKLYLNDGNNQFTEISNSPFRGLYASSVDIGDVDGDEDLDIILIGYDAYDGSYAELYLNNGSGIFTRNTSVPFVGAQSGTVDFVDIDNDEDLDVFITGYDRAGGQARSRLYTNNGSGVFSYVSGTPFPNLNYGSVDFEDIDGDVFKDVVLSGANSTKVYKNNGNNTFTEKTGMSLQAIGTSGYLGLFDADNDTYPDLLISVNQCIIYANDKTGTFYKPKESPFNGVQNSSVAFADIDGDNDLDVLITGQNSSFQKIAELYRNDGSGNYSMVSTTLSGVEFSSVTFQDVDGDEDQDLFITGLNNSNQRIAQLYINDGVGNFALSVQNSFVGVYLGSVAFGDVDGDEDFDVFITGLNSSNQSIAKLYINDGNGIFQESTQSIFSSVSGSSIAFQDIDGDLDVDLLITGSNSSNQKIAELYTNDGEGNFTLLATSLMGVINGSVAFQDIDGDLDADLVITGSNSSNQRITKVYTNDGNGGFDEIESTIEGVQYGSIAFQDVDGDRDQDVFIAGFAASGQRIAKLYLNDGSGNFSLNEEVQFDGVTDGSIAFGDIDGDNDPDLLVTGYSSSNIRTAKLYRNLADFPPVVTSVGAVQIAENSTGPIYTASANEVVTFSLGSSKDESLFVLTNGNEISFASSPDYENPLDEDGDNTYIIDVIATDLGGNSTTLEVSITVTDVDEIAPSFTSASSTSFQENGTGVAYSADADEEVTFSLGTSKDESLFSLANGNEISFVSSPNFEDPLDGDANNAYTIDITATDMAGNRTTLEVTITVTDIVIVGDINGDEIIGIGELAGDINSDGVIGEGEFLGDTNGDGEINNGEVWGDANGDGEIGGGETLILSSKLLSAGRIYPNPFKSTFSIDYEGIQSSDILQVLSIDGKLMKQMKMSADRIYDLSDMMSGVYLIQVTRSGEIILQHRIIKNN